MAQQNQTNNQQASTQATQFSVQQLPFVFEGSWILCQKAHANAKPENCQAAHVPANIEETFADYNGYLLYKTEFSITEQIHSQPLAIYIKHLRDADEIYLNGQLIGQTGSFADNFQKATLYPRIYYLPTNLLNYTTANELILKVYNHARQGGITNAAPVLDHAQNITNIVGKQDAMLMIFIGMMLLITAVQIFYYLAQPENKEHILFAALCLLEASYLYTYSQLALHSGWDLTLIFRFNIFFFCVLTVIFCLFLIKFFKQPLNRLFLVALGVILLAGVSCISFLPIDHIYAVVNILEVVTVTVLIPYYLFLFYRAIKDKLPYSKSMTAVLVLYMLTVVLDIAVDLQVLPPFILGIAGLISPIFLIAVFIAITLILIHKHWHYYRHATYDYLTNSLRRSAFEERLSEELHRIRRTNDSLVVALLDIDNFKQFNDQHSHIVGDQVLQAVAERTRLTLREFDLLGRYGGDEFCIAAEVADQTLAISLLKRLQLNITQEPVIDKEGKPHKINVTIGAFIATPEQQVTAQELIEKADDILVKGKINQKGKVHI
ncbi:MAG: diguanylate cyclase [Kangiellaceae bacterium]|nr:diguanylate cyclase [Kangiellaceae bacterium]